MARAAGTKDLSVVNSQHRHVRHSAVTILANVCCLHVRWPLADGSDAIVAGDAIANDADVIEKGRQPTANIMAVVALIVGRNMSRSLSGSLDAVVTTNTTAGNRGVIHKGRGRPACRDMAIRTLTIGRDVSWRLG